MSSNSDTDVVLRGVSHGAVDYLLKPISIKELRNIWQHVVRQTKSQELDDKAEDRKGGSLRKESISADQKLQRKDIMGSVESSLEGRASQQKKQRVVWSVELHSQFVNAVNSLGIDSKLSLIKEQ